MKDEKCKSVCQRVYNADRKEDKDRLKFLKKGIANNYYHHWIVDNMPITWCYDVENNQKYCSRGFPIGCYVTKEGKRKDACVISGKYAEKDTYYVFNHLEIKMFYHQPVMRSGMQL